MAGLPFGLKLEVLPDLSGLVGEHIFKLLFLLLVLLDLGLFGENLIAVRQNFSFSLFAFGITILDIVNIETSISTDGKEVVVII